MKEEKEQFNLSDEEFDLPRKKITEELLESQLEAYREGRLKSELNWERQESYREGRRVGAFLGVLLMFVFVVLTFIFLQYRYKKCVEINNEELKKCEAGELGNYDCSVFENAEELCSYRYY